MATNFSSFLPILCTIVKMIFLSRKCSNNVNLPRLAGTSTSIAEFESKYLTENLNNEWTEIAKSGANPIKPFSFVTYFSDK